MIYLELIDLKAHHLRLALIGDPELEGDLSAGFSTSRGESSFWSSRALTSQPPEASKAPKHKQKSYNIKNYYMHPI